MSDREFWIKLLVKYKGKCAVCGKEIPAGEYALWSRSSKAIKHEKCETAHAEPAAAVAAAVADELKCFICGNKNAGCAACVFEADCNRAAAEACICEQCFSEKDAYQNYQQAFLAKMAKVKM
ncbi:MAG: hypothetical protein ABI347_05965 [Nitrososphaera sp.]|jgi:hypothetical protein